MADSKSSGTDTVVKVVLIFFISLLSFSIGTFVGKKFSDNQHKMATLEPHSGGKEEGAHEEEVADKQDSHDTHEEESSQAAEPSHGAKASHGKEKSKHSSVDDDELTEDQASSVEDEMVDEDLKASKDHAKTEGKNKLGRMISSEMAQKGIGKYTVQVAAFSSQEEAEKKVNELKTLKLEAFSTETTVKGHQWYRVNVGVFATIKEAQSQKAQLADQAKITNAIIQKVAKK